MQKGLNTALKEENPEKEESGKERQDWNKWRVKIQEDLNPALKEENPEKEESGKDQKGSTPAQKENPEKEKSGKEQKGSTPAQKENPEKEKNGKVQKDTSPSEKPKPSTHKQPVGGPAAGASSSLAETVPTKLAASSSTSLPGPSLSGSGPEPVAKQKPFYIPKSERPRERTFENKVELITRLLSDTPDVEQLPSLLNKTGIKVTTQLVEDVLTTSYKAGAGALKFFHWSVDLLGGKHSPYAWNLLVDILGNNKMFDAMWDAAKSMKADGILSRQTFASIFTCYAMADKANEAMMTFEVMEHYGCSQDVGAFNCLLCALCRYKQTTKALEFCKKMGDKFPPDADTYAILLEGWEKEGNAAKAKKTFGEMVVRLGWDPLNTAAYNAFLGTLCKSGQVDEALKFLHVLRSRNCFPDKSFYSNAVHVLSLQNKADEAAMVFETMLRCGHIPSTITYNSMISTYCYAGKMDDAYRLLDGMVFNGSFPDSVTYNTIFQALIKARKMEEAATIFREMTRNEFDPDSDSYTMALVVKDLNIASMIWKHMSSKGVYASMEFVITFIDTLCDSGKRAEALKYVDEMRDQGVEVSEEILKKVKPPHSKSGKKNTAERSSKKRKEHH
jgi:pentatricopeptide repeat protein